MATQRSSAAAGALDLDAPTPERVERGEGAGEQVEQCAGGH